MNKDKKYSFQNCQDEELTNKFRQLHKGIIKQIICFCKENNIKIDNVSLTADGFRDSIKFGEWTPSTDSCFTIEENIYYELMKTPIDVTAEEYEEAKLRHKPFLISM